MDMIRVPDLTSFHALQPNNWRIPEPSKEQAEQWGRGMFEWGGGWKSECVSFFVSLALETEDACLDVVLVPGRNTIYDQMDVMFSM
jgi:hypothetical protein